MRGPITSPTFVIARVAPAGLGLRRPRRRTGAGPSLVHADAYRLGGVLELDDLDLDTDTRVVGDGGGVGRGAGRGAVGRPAGDRDRTDAARSAAPRPAGIADADLAATMPRTVRITPVGQRWEGVELPLLGLADRL